MPKDVRIDEAQQDADLALAEYANSLPPEPTREQIRKLDEMMGRKPTLEELCGPDEIRYLKDRYPDATPEGMAELLLAFGG